MAEQTRCIHGVQMDADGAHFDGCSKCAGADFAASDTPTPPQAEKLSHRIYEAWRLGAEQPEIERLSDEVAELESDRDAWSDRADSMAEQLIAEKSARMKAEMDALEANRALAHSQDAIKAYCDGENAARQDRDTWKVRAEEAEAELDTAQARAANFRERMLSAEKEMAFVRTMFDETRHRVLDRMGESDKGKGWEWIEEQLAASQAREAKLREALVWVEPHLLQDGPRCSGCVANRASCPVHVALSDAPPAAASANPPEELDDKPGPFLTAAAEMQGGPIQAALSIVEAVQLGAPLGLLGTAAKLLRGAVGAMPQSVPDATPGPCPICTARASEDGLMRYAQAISEQRIDLGRELAEVKAKLAAAQAVKP